ncbi:insecticidal delta-endotoxin Cry8Ea1 family protein [Bacillus paranthracis]|uniref:insecticidal delta-endotoxin Cry8Ea1 family protein n=1 Tax=Bacillus paranthracis TaxID=2026186 RepID=UPI000200EED4|nr:insecticidal delta-endotoxin Cry8Ea1 family protein [Bacillus paranthracis]ADY24755.1 Delta endotoxin central region subgroup 1 [Bacillus thuringiensis serovar finitimus YBT-020]MRC75019.1 hypothetical protein [Bacillus thuringiensis]OTX75967.1 hypothetical protein BK722_04320 [Bacillus thuringiensis serovar finitimus]MCR6801131.1 insecticidal delta-endotoxin Cry8Ea1 family protein [Bacillus paranthracis]MEC3358397.1 insecticidal delta-endotoxin Cry8Ea1 family protein [Bacillus paranthracis
MNSKDTNNVNSFGTPDNKDACLSSPKYPLANDPAASVFGNDDCFQSYGELGIGNFTSPETFIDAQGAISTAISVTGTILGFLGVPFAGQITAFYQKVLGLLWPNQQTKQWEEFMKQVEALIDKKISEAVRSKAIAELQGLGNNLDLYTEALEEWLENKESPETRDRVIQRWRNADSLFEQFMPSFQSNGFEVLLLTVYAQAANLHLLLLRDCSIYGAEWGLTPCPST